MSGLIFPTGPQALPGVDISVHRLPAARTSVDEAINGKEWRSSWWGAPKYRYQLQFNFLRTAQAYRELQKLFTFFASHLGSFDSFLVSDPADNSVTDHGFGVGDGTTTVFQLQRTLGGDEETALGAYPVPHKPRRNRLTVSQPNNQWSYTNTSFAVNAAEAPDGTITATRVRLNAGNVNHAVSRGPHATTAGTRGMWITRSFYVHRDNGDFTSVWCETQRNASQWYSCSWNLLTGVFTSVSGTGGVETLANGWYRCWWTLQQEDTPTPLFVIYLGAYGAYNALGHETILLWGAQDEFSSQGARPTPYMPQIGGPNYVLPAYYPALGDGFEPVFEPTPGVQLYVEDIATGLGRRPLSRANRTNNVLQSQTFNVTWAQTGFATISSGATDPLGGTSAWTLTEDVANNSHQVIQTAGFASRRFVLSLYAKAGTATRLALRTDASTHLARFNLFSGAIELQTNCTAAMEPIGNGWYRISITGVGTASTQTFVIGVTDDAGNLVYTGTGRTMTIWGAQAELDATVAGDYITTTTSTQSRIDYTLGANGQVTFAVAPREGAALSWTGQFWRRCRFAKDDLGAEQIFDQVWRTKTVELVSVIP